MMYVSWYTAENCQRECVKDTVEVVREGEGKRRKRRKGGGGGSGGGGGNGGSDGGVGGGGSEGEWGTQITHILLDFLPAHTHSTLSWCILHRLSPHNKASYDITRAAGHPPQERGEIGSAAWGVRG